MPQLADRLAVLLQKYGLDPNARQADLHALAALEEHDPKHALERFHALKREAAEHRRAHLLHELRSIGLVADVPTHDTRGMNAKEVEREIRDFTRALRHARNLRDSLQRAEDAAANLGEREASWDPTPFERVPLAALADAAERAEAARRALAREARVASRADEARKRARRLKHRRHDVPDVSRALVPDAADADALLESTEAALAKLERLEDAYERATRPLRDPAVSRWKGTTRKQLARDAEALLQSDDVDDATAQLLRLEPRAQALRAEAAALAQQHTRARRRGQSGPEREARPGDAFDGYA